MSLTPRDVLLAPHRAVEAKLDRIRQEVVATAVAATVGSLKTARVAAPAEGRASLLERAWRELFWSCRYQWGGLAAAWVIIVMTNLSTADRSVAADIPSGMLSSKALSLLLEQERLLTDSGGSLQPTSPPSPTNPRPRSDRIPQERHLGSESELDASLPCGSPARCRMADGPSFPQPDSACATPGDPAAGPAEGSGRWTLKACSWSAVAYCL